MSQISPPLRIALIAAIAFLGVWTMFLKPGPEESPPEPAATEAPAPSDPAAQSAAGEAVEQANLSAEAAEANAEALAGGASELAGAPAGSAGAVAPDRSRAVRPGPPDSAALAELLSDVARAVRDRRVIALLFWNPRAADDQRVRRSLQSLRTHDGKVFVETAPLRHLARYAPITRGVDVQQSPTIVVVDRELRAESLSGYVARTTIRQALSDALRAGR